MPTLIDHYEKYNELFQEVSARYEAINDSDVEEAFSLMKDSSSLLDSYEQLSADASEYVAVKERYAKATEARRSCELSSKPTDGARKACFDKEVVYAWKDYANTVKTNKYIEANTKFLSRIYFDSKMIVENCYRRERMPSGDNRVVGRT
jgi:hypothetical protein